jgi:hypothetical protein
LNLILYLFSETSGGFNNPSKMIEYREAFVKSLRHYNRATSAYIKRGGRSGVGMTITPSVNTFEHNARATGTPLKDVKRDYLVES